MADPSVSDRWRRALRPEVPDDVPAEPPPPSAPNVDLGAKRVSQAPTKPSTDELWHRAATAEDWVSVDPKLAARFTRQEKP